MAKKIPKKPAGKPPKPAEEKTAAVPRHQVITFRITAEEATLIRKAADRIPLARFSRDAALARAGADAKK